MELRKTMAEFDPIKHKQEQERNIITRKMVKVPDVVSKFITELLIYNGKRSDYFRTCITCLHWDKQNTCNAYNTTPPPNVIADGCKSYEDEDEIPF